MSLNSTLPWYLDNFVNEPWDRLELELSNVVIKSLEEEIIVWFWKDDARE